MVPRQVRLYQENIYYIASLDAVPLVGRNDATADQGLMCFRWTSKTLSKHESSKRQNRTSQRSTQFDRASRSKRPESFFCESSIYVGDRDLRVQPIVVKCSATLNLRLTIDSPILLARPTEFHVGTVPRIRPAIR